MIPRSYVLILFTCFLLIFNLLRLIDSKKYGTNIIISDSGGGCGGSWSSGGCGGGGKGNIILSSKDKKGKGDKIIISTGGGGGCCGWKPHHHHAHHSWKPVIVPIKVPSYHSHWPLTNWPHTPSWAHHSLDHESHHHHHPPPHKHHHISHHHALPSWDKHTSLASTDLWDFGKQVHHSPSHHLHGDHAELSATPIHQTSPWNDWIDSSALSSSWLKKNDFGSLDELTEDSWNEIW